MRGREPRQPAAPPPQDAPRSAAGGQLEIALSEALLGEMLERWWSGSALGAPVRVGFADWGMPGSASAHVPCPRLQLREGESGRLAFDCRATLEMSWGLPGARHELHCNWLLLVEPRLEVASRRPRAGSIAIVADFARAEIESLDARSRGSWLTWGLPPGFSPPADWGLTELGRFAVAKLLERLGTQRIPIDLGRWLEWFEAAGHGPEALELRVESGWGVLGLPSASPSAPALPSASASPSASGAESGAQTGSDDVELFALRPAELSGSDDGARALLRVGRQVGQRYLASRLERRLSLARPWLRLEPGGGGCDLRLVVRPRSPRLPDAWALPLRARVRLVGAPTRLRAELEGLRLDWRGRSLGLPAWLVGWIGRRLAHAGIPRRVSSPALAERAGELAIRRIHFDRRREAFSIEVGREPDPAGGGGRTQLG